MFYLQKTINQIATIFCIGWVCAILSTYASAQTSPKRFSISELRALPDDAARDGLEVTVRGVLTYHEPAHRMAFLQDSTGSIYLHITDQSEVVAGDEVEVSGFLDPGYNGRNIRGANFDTSPVIKRIGRADFPVPVELSDLSQVEQVQGTRWMSMEAHVLEVGIEGDRAKLTLKENPSLPVYLPGLSRPNQLPNHLRGLRVRLHGVFADSPVSVKPLVMRRILLVPSVEQIVISAEEKAKHFEAQFVGISELPWIRKSEGIHARVKVIGTVTWLQPHEGFFLQTGTSSTWVNCTEPILPTLNQSVICVGRPSSFHGVGELCDAMWQSTSEPETIVEPMILEGGDAKTVTMHGRLIRMEAKNVEVLRGPNETLWVLQAGGTVVFAHLKGSSNLIDAAVQQRGAVISLDGILLNRPSPILDFESSNDALHILLRQSHDLRLLTPAPFWTFHRLVTLLSTIVCIVILAAAWVVALRRKVKQQSELIRATASREAVDAERLRIARDWHDSFEQHFAGLTMQLDAAATMIPSDAPVGSLLERAARMADHSRAEARQAIWDLRDPQHSAGYSFGAELQETLSQSWPDNDKCRLRFRLAENKEILPRMISLQLIRIANVAVTNALKHADCSEIVVSWNEDGEAWILAILDNGKGMPPAAVEQASTEGHFGLLGMRERALRLNASLQIISPPTAETSGTLIRLSLPKSSCHL
jgi:signal transduction histidine kinase